jgi:hypothetical protein
LIFIVELLLYCFVHVELPSYPDAKRDPLLIGQECFGELKIYLQTSITNWNLSCRIIPITASKPKTTNETAK